jgi:hypothetical protein
MKQTMGKLLFFGSLLVILFFVSCAPPVHLESVVEYNVEKERVINKSFDLVWQSTIEWFATHNTPIKNLDKNSGLISTEYSLSLQDAGKYMDCGKGTSSFMGEVQLVNHGGNFNVLIKKLDENSTRVSINVFFGCTENKYKYESLLSTNLVLVSSTRVGCVSTGQLEKEILDYLSSK